MRIFQHHVLATPARAAQAVAAGLLASAGVAAAGAGGRVWGCFVPMIGLSNNHVVLLTEFPDEAAARSVDVLAGAAVSVERHEFWEPDPRPGPGDVIAESEGFFSHRWFDCADADWPRFRELSVTAWDNFEDVHDTRVAGFWRSRTPPAPGLTRVWLMAWYKDLAAWQGSRFVLNPVGTRAEQAFANFRARRDMTVDSAVSMVRRVV